MKKHLFGKSSQMLSIVLISLFLLANSGQIHPHDIIISPNNKNTLSEITLIFTLDTTIATTDYLRVVLPFRLNSPQPGTWDTYVDCSLATTGQLAKVIPSVLPSDSTSYFIQFYSDLAGTALSGLTANITYYVKFSGTPDLSGTTGINLPVQVSTVSTTKQSYVVYDQNSAFGTLTLAASYASTMTVFVNIPSTVTNYNVLGASYNILVDITPTITIKNRARVDIELTNSNFRITSCTSIASTGENIPLLPATYVVAASNRVRLTITQTLTAGSGAKYRFQCTVQNPALPDTTKVTVRNLYGYIETITESGTDSTGLQAATTASTGTTSAWVESSHQVQLGWGVQASSPNALNIFGLYKDASPTERWYQSMKTIFKPKTALTYTDPVQVVISTVNDAGFKLLTASIYHNLPDYSLSATVTCAQRVQGYVHCQNVGALTASSYFVSFRFGLLSTTSAIQVTDFGKVSVQSMDTSPVVLIPLSLTTLTYQTIRSNIALFTSGSPGTNGIIASSTTVASSTPTTYVTNGESVILKFAFKYFTNTFIPLITTSTIDRGIEFYTSSALASSASPTCSINTLTQTTDVTITDCSVTQDTTNVYTRLRFRLASFAQVTSGTAAYNLFTSSPLDGTILFNSVTFSSTQFSSLNYVSENVFDYYTRWVQNFTAINPTIVTATSSSPFFFNSIVYKSGALANLQVGTSLFVTGQYASDVGNDGTYFPSMIRVVGANLPSGETTGVTRILVFFNDLVPLNTDTPCFGSVAVTCTYDANAVDTTQTNGLTDYSGSRRIAINFAGASRFNVYIPVKTTTMKMTYGFFVATAAEISTAATAQNIFATQNMARTVVYTSTAYNTSSSTLIAAAGGVGPKMNVPGSTAMGSTVTSTTIQNSYSSAYVPSTVNSGPAVGANYAYCANYDFTTASGFTMQTYYSSGAVADQDCVAVQYSPSTTKDVTCYVCPVYSTMSSTTISVTKLTMPNLYGIDYADFTYAVGNPSGDLRSAAKDTQAGVLTSYTMSSLSLTFNPTTFKKISTNAMATLSFTVVSELPQTIRINLTPTSGSLYLAPVSSVACVVNTVAYTSCVTSGSASNAQLDIVAQGTTWPVGTHTISFMVDASGASGLVSYRANLYVNGISAMVLHHTSNTQTYTVVNDVAGTITLANATYLFTNQAARTILTVTFVLPDDIIVYSNQKITFNLGSIATANSGVVPYCRIINNVTLVPTNDFAVCDASDLTAVTLQPKTSVIGEYILELHFLKVPSSGTTGISAKVLAADGTTVVAQTSAALALPTSVANSLTPTANVNLDRLYSDPGEVAEVILNIKPSVSAIALGTFMYIYFPTYYPDQLGYENIWCTANDLPISCFVIKSRLMQLTSFPVSVAVGTSVQIRIYGVVTPAVTVPPGKVFIGLAPQATPYVLAEQIEVSDKASNSVIPTALRIDFYTVTTNMVRETADHTIIFTTSSSGISANNKISIDFADRFGGTLRGQEGPYIYISKVGDTVVTQVQAISFGSRFKITLPLDLDPSSQYQFVLQGIDNPEQPICNMDKPMVIVTNANEYAATYRTAPNIWDVPAMSFVLDSGLKALSWTDSTGTAIVSLTLTIGIFSPEIRIVPPTGESFNGDVTFTTSQTDVSILPGVLKATAGSSYLSLRVGADISSLPSIVLLDLDKDEVYANSVYTQVPKLQLILTNTLQALPLPTISIMIGGTSLPYEWDLSALNLIPHTQLQIDVTIDDPTGPLSVVGPTTLIFTPDSYVAGFVFALDASATVGSPPTFTLALSGTDAAYYTIVTDTVLTSQVTVTVLAANSAAPTLTQATATANYAATRQQFQINCDQIASVYWHVAYANELQTTDCLRVRASYLAGTAYDSASADQAQYGVFYVFTPATLTNFEISNLISNTQYSYILCPNSQLDNMGTSTTNTFQTKDNGAILSQVVLTFSSAINRNQLASILCVFVKDLQLPNDNVVATDGTTCAYPSVYDSFATFSYNSITVYISGNKNTDATSTTAATLSQYATDITTPPVPTTTFLTDFYASLQGAGIKSLFQTMTYAVGPTYTAPVIDTTASVAVTANITYVILSNLKLSSGTGVFFGIATTDTTDVPTTQQIKNKLNADGTSASGANALYDGTNAVSLTFTNLQANTAYIIYYYALNSDRTQYAGTTSIKYVQTQTQPQPVPVSASKVEVGVLTVLILTVFAWLM